MQQAIIGTLEPARVAIDTPAGETIESASARAQGNNEPIGEITINPTYGWFAVRPSGTEGVARSYAESVVDQSHLRQIREDAQQIVRAALGLHA